MSRKENISNLKTEKEGITILRELMVPAKVVVVLLCFYLFFHLGLSSLPHICLLENTIHLHCPFCGLTFAFEEILRGNLLVALVSKSKAIRPIGKKHIATRICQILYPPFLVWESHLGQEIRDILLNA